jgi:hypothetical protein
MCAGCTGGFYEARMMPLCKSCAFAPLPLVVRTGRKRLPLRLTAKKGIIRGKKEVILNVQMKGCN